MKDYKIIKGNLIDIALSGGFDYIFHGANCQSIMGAGIAKEIKYRIPEMHIADGSSHRTPLQKWGGFTAAAVKEPAKGGSFVGVNLYTQLYTGANYNATAFRMSLKKAKMFFEFTPTERLGFPLIGCGIGGGIREEMLKIIEEELSGFDVTIVEYEP